ncbi:MAG TPA: agmatine deiminase, partial [Bacillota bacterium]|nr:agmatine deiminase [Bacillota bacterium]
MAKRIDSTPKADGFRMPAEFEPQQQIFMIWPERPDNWRDGGKPAQKAFADVAKAISEFAEMTMLVSASQYQVARNVLPPEIRVIEMSNNDSWVRDCGPTFVINDKGGIRGVDWKFNAWGGLFDGLYFPWDQDDLIARKICDMERIDTYRTEDFVLEGGSIHVDGEGTVMTTEMCLLSEGRNPKMSREEIENMLKNHLNIEKVIWIKDGIDPEETNGHIDDVACFVRPGEAACIWTDNKEDPFYETCKKAYETLTEATDAKGRKLKVHKLTMPEVPVTIKGDFAIDEVEGT